MKGLHYRVKKIRLEIQSVWQRLNSFRILQLHTKVPQV